MADQAVDHDGTSSGPARSGQRFGFYRSYLIVILMLIYAMTLVDRLVLSLLLQDIKLELGLSDTQLGVLTGIAFALFYAAMGIPLARWADRGNRIQIISLTTGFFSMAVALSSAAVSFTQLMIARICIGAGEAGTHPIALSLISDSFGRRDRPRAVARYLLAGPIALFCGYLGAGWLNEMFSWRKTLFLMALPGLVLAVIVWTLKEPRRLTTGGNARPVAQAPRPDPSGLGLRSLLHNRVYVHLWICLSLQAFFIVGVFQWQPSFFVRSFGMSTGELGTWMAVCYGVTGFIGTWLGGEIATRYAGSNEHLQLIAIMFLFLVLAVVKPFLYLMPSYPLAFGMLALVSFLAGLGNGPIFSMVQTIVPAEIRATATAILLFGSNLIGSGLGPLAAGMLSDALTPIYGVEALRYVLVIMSPGYLWVALHVWFASRHIKALKIPNDVTHV